MIPNPRRDEWPEAVREMLHGYDAHYLGSWPVALAQTDDPNDLAGKRPGPGLLKAIRDRYLPDYQVETGGHRGYVLTTVELDRVAHEFFTLTRRVKKPENAGDSHGFIDGYIIVKSQSDIRHSFDTDDADLELWFNEVVGRRNTEQQKAEAA